MLANQQRPDWDVLQLVIVPGFLLLIAYIFFESPATAAIGWLWKFGYAVGLFFMVSYLIRKLLLKWRLSRTERVKFVEGFLAGYSLAYIEGTEDVGAGGMAATRLLMLHSSAPDGI